MKILSQYKDFYDCVPLLIGESKTKLLPKATWNRKVFISDFHQPYILQEDENGIFARKIRSKEEKLSLKNPPLLFDKNNGFVSLFVLGFCGKTLMYALFHGDKNKNVAIFGNKILERFDDKSKVYDNIKELVEIFHDRVDDELFSLYQRPTFVFGLNDSYKIPDKKHRRIVRERKEMDIHDLNNVVFDPKLSAIYFNKYKHHTSTYIELNRYIYEKMDGEA